MTTKLVWRLHKLPTADELRDLVKDKIITQEEAREILFNSETEEDRDKKSLESEIKFLRELVEKLSDGKHDRIVEVIKYVETPYRKYPWYNPYMIWCSSPNLNDSSNYTVSNAGLGNSAYMSLSSQSGSGTGKLGGTSDFSNIKTF